MNSSLEEKRHFDEHVKLIKKLANIYSVQYRKDFDDMYEVGLEYYAWSLKHYDPTKGTKFSTYLYQQVAERMIDECLKQRRQMPMLYNDFHSSKNEKFNFEDCYADCEDRTFQNREDLRELRKLAKEKLSYEGFLVFNWLLSFQWIGNNIVGTPTKTMAKRDLGLTGVVVQMAWDEVGCFWNQASKELMVA